MLEGNIPKYYQLVFLDSGIIGRVFVCFVLFLSFVQLYAFFHIF